MPRGQTLHFPQLSPHRLETSVILVSFQQPFLKVNGLSKGVPTSQCRHELMRIAAVSKVDMTVDPVRASAEFNMFTRKLQAGVLIALSLAGMVGLLLPVGLIAVDAASNPQVLNSLSEHLGSAALLASGVFVGIALLTFPLRSGLARLSCSGRVEMADGMVHVERRGLVAPERWSAPLAQFCGVTHHIRATLSGPRHEIILVHPEPSKDVLLHVAHRHPQDGADHFARLLGLPELPPRELYNRHRRAPNPAPAPAHAAQPELQAKAA